MDLSLDVSQEMLDLIFGTTLIPSMRKLIEKFRTQQKTLDSFTFCDTHLEMLKAQLFRKYPPANEQEAETLKAMQEKSFKEYCVGSFLGVKIYHQTIEGGCDACSGRV